MVSFFFCNSAQNRLLLQAFFLGSGKPRGANCVDSGDIMPSIKGDFYDIELPKAPIVLSCTRSMSA